MPLEGSGVSLMIRGIHGLFYTSQPEEARAFVRDKLQLPFTDVGDGWLIFDLHEGDVGFHPIEGSGKPASGTHDISFYCDDIQGTVATLKKRGVIFDQEVSEAGFGFITYFTMPGAVRVMLYEPKYAKPKQRLKKEVASRRKSRQRHC
jgi:Glyoxalase/Bleomycin resistance protein/Dioxygenase superfamily